MAEARDLDLGPLTWVKSEIELALVKAGESLEKAAGPDASQSGLQFAQSHLHQACGALSIVGLDGLTQFANTLEQFIGLLARGERALDASSVDLGRRGLAAIGNYLEELVHGTPDQALRLSEIYAEVATSCALRSASPSDLFFPDTSRRPPRHLARVARLEASERASLVRAQRALFQRGLLKIIRNLGDRTGAQELLDAARNLEPLHDKPAANALWWAAQAFFEALLNGDLPDDPAVKRLCSALDKELGRESLAAGNMPERMMRELLYFVALSPARSPLQRAVRETWQIDALIPEAGARVSEIPLSPLLKALRAELATVKQGWDEFSSGKAAALPLFEKHLAQLRGEAQRLGRPMLNRLLEGLAGFTQWLRKDPLRFNDVVAIEIAAAQLLIEAALGEGLPEAGFAAQVGDTLTRLAALTRGEALPTAEKSATVETARRGEEREALNQVAREILSNLSHVEQRLDDFFRNQTKRAPLAELSAPLKQIQGALALIGDDEASALIRTLGTRIAALASATEEEPAATFEDIAHQLSALGFYVQALEHGRAKLDTFLRPEKPAPTPATEESIEPTVRISVSIIDPAGAAPAPAQAPESIATDGALSPLRVRDDEADVELESLEAFEPLADEQPDVTAQPVVTAPVEPASEQDIDAELLSIFIEEAHEVLATIADELRTLRGNPGDTTHLTAIRRGYHTLKGSGRMVGLVALGDVAWSIEQTLNHCLQLELEPNAALFALIEEAHGFFTEWVRDIESGEVLTREAGDLVAHAEALRERPAPASADVQQEVAQTDLAAPPTVVEELDTDSAEAVEAEAVYGTTTELMELELELDNELPADPLFDRGMVDTAFLPDSTQLESLDFDRSEAEFPTLPEPAPAHAPSHDTLLLNLPFDTPAPEAGITDETPDEPTGEAAAAADLTDEAAAAAEHTGESTPPSGDWPIVGAEPAAPDGNAAFSSAATLVEPEMFDRISLDESAVPNEAADALPDAPLAPTGELPVVPHPVAERASDAGTSEPTEALEPPKSLTLPEPRDDFLLLEDDEAIEGGGDGPPSVADSLLADAELEGDVSDFSVSVEPDFDFGDLVAPSFVPADVSATTPSEDAGSAAATDWSVSEPDEAVTGDTIHLNLDLHHAEEDRDSATAPAVESEPEPPPTQPEVIVLGEVEISRPLMELYLGEAQQHIARLHEEFDQLRFNPTRPPSEAAMRAAHTLGGISGTARIMSIHHLAKGLEHAIERLRERGLTPRLDQLDLLEAVIDRLEGMLDEVRKGSMPLFVPEFENQLDEVGGLKPEELPALESYAENTLYAADAREPQALPPVTDALVARAPVTEPEPSPQVHDDLDEQLLPIFIEEAGELLSRLNAELRAWHDDKDNSNHAKSIARLLHTLKGSARMTGAMTLGEQVHQLESRLDIGLKTALPADTLIEELTAGLDHSQQMMDVIVSGEAPAPEQPSTSDEALPTAPAALTAVTVDTDSTAELGGGLLRVKADVVDRLVNEAGEIGIARTRIEGELRTLRRSLLDLTENVIRLRNQLREVEIQADVQMQSRIARAEQVRSEFDPLEMDRYTRLQELTRLMAESVGDVTTVQQNLLRNLDGAELALHGQARMSRDLQQALMQVRMVPFESLADRLYRVVRQSAKDLGKRVNLDLRGGRIEVDRSVLERITPALEHLLRNAVAHGIESTEARTAAGKDGIGQVSLTVTHEGNEIVLTLADDGRGLNYDAIAERARERGLLGTDEQADARRLTNLIFVPGFSTAENLSALSGRGVGMDVVKSETAAVGGRLDVFSTPGQGTTFRVFLPLTLAVTQAVLVRAAQRSYAIPSNMVAQVLELKADAMGTLIEAGGTDWNGEHFSYRYLPHLLGDHEARPELGRFNWVLLLRAGAQTLALHVDHLRGNQEIVVKNAGPQLVRIIGIAGATVLGDGEIVLILNPVALASRRQASAVRPLEPGQALAAVQVEHIPTVMIVDDSLTVRKITGRLMEREGYRVITAKDGTDALEKLLETLPDVVLSDIEMPRMDGFDLVRHIRADERLRHLPVIMITSRLADKHREYAMKVGANHYLGKPFEENELLGLIRSYIAPPAQ